MIRPLTATTAAASISGGVTISSSSSSQQHQLRTPAVISKSSSQSSLISSLSNTQINNNINVTTAHRPGTASILSDHHVRILTHHATNRPVTGAGGFSRTNISKRFSEKKQQHFETLLESKYKAIQNENLRLENETASLINKQNRKHILQSKFEDLLSQVKELEGVLSDYNMVILAMSTSSTNNNMNLDYRNTDEILFHQKQLQQKNQNIVNELDEIFLNKKELESDVSLFQNKIIKIHLDLEHKLQSIIQQNPGMQQKVILYQKLSHQIHLLNSQSQVQEQELEELSQTVQQIESKRSSTKKELLHRSQVKKRIQVTQDEITSLQHEYDMLQSLLLDDGDKNGEQHRYHQEFFLDKIKQNNSKSSNLNKQIQHIDQTISNLQKSQQDLLSDLIHHYNSPPSATTTQHANNHATSEESMANKKEKLLSTKNKLQSNIQTLQNKISILHQNINLSKNDKYYTKDDYKEMKSESTFSTKQLDFNKYTNQQLEQQKQQRLMELQKIQDLESKIIREQDVMQKKSIEMKKDIEIFTDIQRLHESYSKQKTIVEDQIRSIDIQNQDLQKKISLALDDTRSIATKLQKQNNESSANTIQKELKELEQKILQYNQNIHSLEILFQRKEKEIEYQHITKLECLEKVRQLNKKNAVYYSQQQ